MKNSSYLRTRFLLLAQLVAAVTACLSQPRGCFAQDVDQRAKNAYFRTVGAHFHVPLQEVTILGDWEMEPEEVPVVLFVAGRVGVSPDAVAGLRSGGRSWMAVALRFGLDAGAFHLSLPRAAPLGALSSAYESYRNSPPREWRNIRLEDADLIALVNLRLLSEQLGFDPVQVLQVWNETGDFVACHRDILEGVERLLPRPLL